MTRIYEEQPNSSPGVWNWLEYRPLEGFVFAVTPFNFTAIGGNLPPAPALMGNTVVWKPASTAAYSAHFVMRILQEAGLPDGVINLVYGHGADDRRRRAGQPGPRRRPLHRLDRGLQRDVEDDRRATSARYRNYPRIVGETGGKDFIVAHPTADVEAVVTAVVRGSFEYQGQKCSAASRIYIPESTLARDARAARRPRSASSRSATWPTSRTSWAPSSTRRPSRRTRRRSTRRSRDGRTIVAGGTADDGEGLFVQPTVIETARSGLPAAPGGALRADRHRVRLSGRRSGTRRSSSSTRPRRTA